MSKASPEAAVRSFVEHVEKMQADLAALLAAGALTNEMVVAHGAAQKAEIARFDAWLVEAGWSMAELMELIRTLAIDFKASSGGAGR